MICQATYESLEAIPENLRDEFEQKNGKWQLKESAIPGVGPLFNAALQANHDKAVGQVKARNTRIGELESELNTLKDRLSVIDTPGAKVLSAEDAATFEKYAKLGTPKELEEKLKAHDELSERLGKLETAKTLKKVAEAAGLGDVKLNPDVLTDWLTSADGKGLQVFVKTVETADSKGNKVSVELPFIRIESEDGGKTKVTEHELLPFAKEKLPEWKYAALISGGQTAQTTAAGKPVSAAAGATAGVKLPDLSSAKAAPGPSGDKKRPVDIENEKRAARPSPFAKPSGQVIGMQPPR